MAKIKIDRELCIGCGSCQAVCHKFFKIKEDGKSSALIEETEKLECAESAAESCPVQCIHIEK